MLYEVILDIGETANKCTIAPLADRPDFRLLRVSNSLTLGPLVSPILLHHEGECLTRLRAQAPEQIAAIASIDCVWRRLDPLLQRLVPPCPIRARIPDGFVTAYPRRSRGSHDPHGGLATIEAIFIASALLGTWDLSLLSAYYFGPAFLAFNEHRFLELGVEPARGCKDLPQCLPRARDSRQRRLDRGRGGGS